MTQIHPNLYIGTDRDCRPGNDELAVVHACKSPCHQRAVGYRGNLPDTHPNYLVKEGEFDLWLNIIDPPVPLFKAPLFTSFLDFAKTHLDQGRKVLVHCNRGESRSPSLALLYLAKHTQIISEKSYEMARKEFKTAFPSYNPGRGIQIYLSENCDTFLFD